MSDTHIYYIYIYNYLKLYQQRLKLALNNVTCFVYLIKSGVVPDDGGQLVGEVDGQGWEQNSWCQVYGRVLRRGGGGGGGGRGRGEALPLGSPPRQPRSCSTSLGSLVGLLGYVDRHLPRICWCYIVILIAFCICELIYFSRTKIFTSSFGDEWQHKWKINSCLILLNNTHSLDVKQDCNLFETDSPDWTAGI